MNKSYNNINVKTIGDAYHKTINNILSSGTLIEEYPFGIGGDKFLEINNMTIRINNTTKISTKRAPKVSSTAMKFFDVMLFTDDKRPQSLRTTQQLDNIVKVLLNKKGSKKAVISVWDNKDIFSDYVVSLTQLQFLIRDDLLHLSSVFRSHDMYNGFYWNTIGCIGLMKDVVKSLSDKYEIGLGTYSEFAVSAHIQSKDTNEALKSISK